MTKQHFFLGWSIAIPAIALFVLGARPASAAAVNCGDLDSTCLQKGNCPVGRDIGPADDCKSNEDKTCCANVKPCRDTTSRPDGTCKFGGCADGEKAIGPYDCQNLAVCCVSRVSCTSQGGTCKAKCAKGESKSSAEDCTGSKKLCCVPPAGPAPVVPKECSALGGGDCVPSITGCSEGYDNKTSESTCDIFDQLCCVPKAGTLGTTTSTGGATPKATKPAEPKTIGPFGLTNPLGNRSVPQLLGQLVAWLGAIGGSLFFGYLMWGGIQWMTAGGSNERVKAGRSKIIAAVSGIVVIMLAYLIIESLIGVISLK